MGDILRRLGADASPGIRDDAVGTKAVAPVLDLDERAGAALEVVDLQRLQPRVVLPDVHNPPAVLEEGGEMAGQGAAGRVAQHDVRLGEALRLLGEGLGHAAGERQHGVGVVPPAAAQQLPQLPVAFAGHGAGVDDQPVGGQGRLVAGDKLPRLEALGLQKAAHGLGFVLVHLAAQGVKDNFHKNEQPFPCNPSMSCGLHVPHTFTIIIEICRNFNQQFVPFPGCFPCALRI